MKYPVCFECFDNIIGKIETKIYGQESERDLYIKEIKRIEGKLAKLQMVNESDLESDLLALEA